MCACQIAFFIHLVLEAGDLFLVDEYAQFAGVFEIHHGREEGRRFDAHVLLRRHIRKGGGQKGAADAVADGVDFVFAGGLFDGIQRR